MPFRCGPRLRPERIWTTAREAPRAWCKAECWYGPRSRSSRSTSWLIPLIPRGFSLAFEVYEAAPFVCDRRHFFALLAPIPRAKRPSRHGPSRRSLGVVPPQAGTHNHRPVIMGPGSRAIACRKMRARPGRQQRALKRASLAQSPVDVRSRDRLAPVVRIGFGLLFFGRRGAASGAAVAAASACLRAIAARHFAGWTLRSARNWRFSASLNVASYARRARASYRQAKSANTANAIGTTRGIMRQAITVLGLWRTAYRRPCAGESTTAGPAARRRDACPSATRSDGGMP